MTLFFFGLPQGWWPKRKWMEKTKIVSKTGFHTNTVWTTFFFLDPMPATAGVTEALNASLSEGPGWLRPGYGFELVHSQAVTMLLACPLLTSHPSHPPNRGVGVSTERWISHSGLLFVFNKLLDTGRQTDDFSGTLQGLKMQESSSLGKIDVQT